MGPIHAALARAQREAHALTAVVTARPSCGTQGPEGARDGEDAEARWAEVRSSWSMLGVPYEEGPALKTRGRCLVALARAPEAAAQLAEAREIFARLGARPALAETEAFLEQLGDQ